MRGAFLHVALAISVALLVERKRLQQASPPTRWVSYLLYGLSTAIYIAAMSWPDAPRPAFFLVELLRQVSPTH